VSLALSPLSLHDALPISTISKLATGLLHHQQWATLRSLTEPGAIEPLVGTPLLADFAGVSADELRAAIREALDASGDSTAALQRSEEHTSELQSPYDLVC